MMVNTSNWKIQKSLICSDEKVTRGLKTTEIMPSLFKSEVNLAVLFLFGCELHLSCHLLACKLVVWNPGNSKISDDSFSDAALAAFQVACRTSRCQSSHVTVAKQECSSKLDEVNPQKYLKNSPSPTQPLLFQTPPP